MGKKILLAPALQKGMGTGHLARSLSLKCQLKEECFILDEASVPEFDIRQHPLAEKEPVTVSHPRTGALWDLILLDRKATPLKDYLKLNQYGPVIGLDEGGPARPYLPYLIDTLPGLKSQSPANNSALSLLDLPRQKKNSFNFPFTKVLLSFGGEDAANLSGKLIKALLSGKRFQTGKEQLNITLVQGPYFKQKTWPAGITVLYAPLRLKEQLYQFDLVITSFGLTCFEALAAGVPVILFNPTAYHQALSREAGLPEIGVGKPRLGRLKKLIAKRTCFEKQLASFAQIFRSRAQEPATLSDFISVLAYPDSPTGSPAAVSRNRCPVCSKPLNPAIARFRHKTYFRCRQCGLLYMHYFALTKPADATGKEEKQGKPARRYTAAYFLSEYKEQYGKTYLEDFPNLKKLARQRLAIISRLLGRDRTGVPGTQDTPGAPGAQKPQRPQTPKRKLDFLDIGCALGPFLVTGRENGLQPWGMDISAEAVAHVKKQLGIPCLTMDFEQISLTDLQTQLTTQWQKKEFSLITMWYVIEHFKDLKGVLRKINGLLPRGGLFAFSTPNGAGVSGKSSLLTFLDQSPRDHYTIWTPALAEDILKSFGFKVSYIRSTGHHPERFSFLGRKPFKGLKPGSRRWLFLAHLSRLLKWGDTFEVYAVKVKDLS